MKLERTVIKIITYNLWIFISSLSFMCILLDYIRYASPYGKVKTLYPFIIFWDEQYSFFLLFSLLFFILFLLLPHFFSTKRKILLFICLVSLTINSISFIFHFNSYLTITTIKAKENIYYISSQPSIYSSKINGRRSYLVFECDISGIVCSQIYGGVDKPIVEESVKDNSFDIKVMGKEVITRR